MYQIINFKKYPLLGMDFAKLWYSFWRIYIVYIKYEMLNVLKGLKNTAMKQMRQTLVIVLIMLGATVIGWVKGNEAKQKWVYKRKTSFEEKRQLAKKRMAAREGQVQLDDIEWASFHKN